MFFFGWLALVSAHRAVSSSGSHPASWINQTGSKHNSVWAQKLVLQTCFQPEHFQFTALQHRRKYTMPIWNSNIFETNLSSMPFGIFLHSSSFSNICRLEFSALFSARSLAFERNNFIQVCHFLQNAQQWQKSQTDHYHLFCFLLP